MAHVLILYRCKLVNLAMNRSSIFRLRSTNACCRKINIILPSVVDLHLVHHVLFYFIPGLYHAANQISMNNEDKYELNIDLKIKIMLPDFL